jgi:16S rRNA (uracil1498-N3)-methyltransferase
MHRFFLTADSFDGESVHFPEKTAHQIRRVLRLRAGQLVTVLDNRGSEFEVALSAVDAHTVAGQIQVKRTASHEPRTWLHLYLGLTQREKFEWMLQLITSRSLVQGREEAAKKIERWEHILREAAEQAGRGIIPELHLPITLPEAVCEAVGAYHLSLMAWEGEPELGVRQALDRGAVAGVLKPHLACFIGPEGGFSSQEADLAREAGVLTITLGERILRMETAAVVATAVLMYELG